MSEIIKGYVKHNDKGLVQFIQFQCTKCDNFEEPIVKNGDYKLKNFGFYTTGIDKAPLKYTCKKCNNETNFVHYLDEALK